MKTEMNTHWQRHIELHSALDELFADYIANHPNATKFTEMPIIELINWSATQAKKPTH